jgi:hypothetical protein
VYSGLVIHCIADDEDLKIYLRNAYITLRPGGIFFGTIMVTAEEVETFSREFGLQRLTSAKNLINSITGAGFISPEIVERPILPGLTSSLIKTGLAYGISRSVIRYLFENFPGANNYNRYMLQFCAEKPMES